MNETIARYEKLLEQYPDNELARFSLGKAFFDLGEFRSASPQFEKALAKRPDWMVVQILLGKCHQSLGDPKMARECFLKAKQLAIDQHHEGPLAEMEQLLGELDE